MSEREDTLRHLALHDERVITSILAMGMDTWNTSCIDARRTRWSVWAR